MEEVLRRLAEIVGPSYVSNHPEERFIYSRDMGTMPPAAPDLVVMPGSAEEVQQIVMLANEKKIPVVPMGGGLVLSGLTRALKGGMVVDLKRMNRIHEVNETSRYALVEAGASQGMLQAYLKKHHPRLKHSLPDAPPIATIGGNVLIHGSGHLSAVGGYHSEMLNGLEVVLPTGEMARLGSCAVSPYWVSRAPLPDLSGLFIGWAGTTGIVTKLAVKLYPARRFSDAEIFLTEDAHLVTEVLHRLTEVGVAEDVLASIMSRPAYLAGFQQTVVVYGADSREELKWKRNLLYASVRPLIEAKTGGFAPAPAATKNIFIQAPNMPLARFADLREGGGFEYVGAIMPLELFGPAYDAGIDIAARLAIPYGMGARIVGLGHSMMFFYAYPFNRADEATIEQARQALEKTNEAVLAMGGIPWKAEEPAQKQIIRRMDPHTFDLMNRLRAVLDPKGIMNPGNWEA